MLQEALQYVDIHRAANSHPGGFHFEMSPMRVTECVGGSARGTFGTEFTDCRSEFQGVAVEDVGKVYLSSCDPRLNDMQALELVYHLSNKLAQSSC